jgi:hypothetical protein
MEFIARLSHNGNQFECKGCEYHTKRKRAVTSHPGKIHFATQSRKMSGILSCILMRAARNAASVYRVRVCRGPGGDGARVVIVVYMRMGVCVYLDAVCCGCCWVVKEGDALVCVRCELHETNLCTYVRPVVYYADQARWMDRVPIIKQRQTSATRHCALSLARLTRNSYRCSVF